MVGVFGRVDLPGGPRGWDRRRRRRRRNRRRRRRSARQIDRRSPAEVQGRRRVLLRRSDESRDRRRAVASVRTSLVDRYRVQLVLPADVLVPSAEPQGVKLLRVLLLAPSRLQGVVLEDRRIAPGHVVNVVVGPQMAHGRLVTGTAVAEADSSAGRPRGARRGREGMMQRAMQSRNSGKLRGNQLKQNAASGHSHTHNVVLRFSFWVLLLINARSSDNAMGLEAIMTFRDDLISDAKSRLRIYSRLAENDTSSP